TLHQLAEPPVEQQEAALAKYAERRPVTLVLPALYSEVQGEALPKILDHLADVKFVGEVVMSMNRMDGEQFAHAKDFLSRMGQPHRILWNDGPRVTELYKKLEQAHLTSYVPGKGYNVWMAIGYILAKGEARVIATHDSDILSYHREMLHRLCMPTMHPNLAYQFCKSYYGRVSDRMYGRVTRLFVAPLLRAFRNAIGNHQLLEYLENFRYPLSGEFSMSLDLARTLRMPGDWGLEMGMLCEVYRNTTMRRICQVDLGGNFEHKHQHLGADETGPKEASEGLTKMARDVALALLSNLVADGVVLSEALMKTVRFTYERMAKESIQRYHDDATINGLQYFRHEEADAVEAFTRALGVAGRAFLKESYVSPQIPNWNRVNSALPDFGEQLLDAVEADNA
ncbi:MAG: glucosyl-3-phosphoglycerate synthase, partial [Verrucomicrobiales bacterium]